MTVEIANAELRSVFEQAYALGRSIHPPIGLPNGDTGLIVPKGYEVKVYPPAERQLLRVRQEVTLHDEASFIAYLKRYGTANTRLFAEPGFLAERHEACITAIVDYHADSASPNYGVHVARYRPRYSDQWNRWVRATPGALRQAEFAEFIEENRADIAKPEAARLLDVVRAFKATKKSDFNSVVYQPNGDVTLQYDERTEQQGSSGPVPEHMVIGIPCYFRGTVYAVNVFVRFKVGNGAVNFTLKPDRADVVEDAAFGEIIKRVTEATAIEAYLGRR